jgi:hypothetical protein
VFSILNIEYPMSNIEGKQRVYLWIGFSVKFGVVILQRPKRFHHSTFLVGPARRTRLPPLPERRSFGGGAWQADIGYSATCKTPTVSNARDSAPIP